MSEQIRTINSKKTKIRIILSLFVIFALVFAWFAVRWQIGDMLAALTSAEDPNAVPAAAAAQTLAPRDPQSNWLAASVEKNPSSADFENVVRLAPNDFRWWIELARSYEQEEKLDKAEQSFKRAAEIAPAYAYPHWQLGNFYLRQDHGGEAFAELKKAAAGNDIYPEQIFGIAWDFYGKNAAKLAEIAGDSSSANKSLVKFYLSQERPADALEVYNSLAAADKTGDANFGKFITDISYQKRFFRASVEFARQSGINPESKAENLTNGNFEKDFVEPDSAYFDWRLTPTNKIDIKTDATQKHEGNRSLRIVFNGFANSYIGAVQQIAAVESGRKYHLSFWVRTENLKSAGLPDVEIINANDDKLVAVTKPFAAGSNDWQQIELDFAAPENCQGITVKLGRAYCGEQCPVYGAVWLDGFRLTK